MFTPALEYELAAPPWVRVRYARGIRREGEWEYFDPVPPAPGTVLLTRFAFGRATLSAGHRALIARVAATVVAGMPGIPPLHCAFIEVEGHEDEVGDPALFGRLGRARADAVVKVLAPRLEALIRRLPAAQQRPVNILVSSAGPRRPIRSNLTAEGRALNRRVEIRSKVAPCGLIV